MLYNVIVLKNMGEYANTFNPATIATSPEQRREICNKIVDQRIQQGFHTVLGISRDEYAGRYDPAIEKALALRKIPQGAILTLVDPSIPFFDQVSLVGLTRDPAVYYQPKEDVESQPYPVLLKVLRGDDDPIKGVNQADVVSVLPEDVRPATPFEGISAWQAVLERGFVSMHGGDFSQAEPISVAGLKPLVLCLDRYLGKPRVTHMHTSEDDYFVGTLVALR